MVGDRDMCFCVLVSRICLVFLYVVLLINVGDRYANRAIVNVM